MKIIQLGWGITVAATFAVSVCSARATEKIERQREVQPEGVKKVEADPQKGFRHPYLLLVPAELVANPAIVVALPTPATSTNAIEYLAAAERIAHNAGPHLAKLNVPILVPVLPRPPVATEDGNFINLYIPALSRAALLATNASLERIDRQVLAMLDHARDLIRKERGIEVQPRAIFAGFSAAGHFATRMAVLHPERTRAVWAGGIGGHPILPLKSLDGRTLTYPVGIGDLAEIAGKETDLKSFAQIPICLVQGGKDANTALPDSEGPSDSYSYEQAQLIRELLGISSLERLKKVEEIYRGVGSKIEVRVFPEAAHQMTREIVRDMIQFIATQTAKYETK